MMFLFGLIDVIIIFLAGFIITKFWILKIPEIKVLLTKIQTKSTIKLAKKKYATSEELNNDVDSIIEKIQVDREKIKKRKENKRSINQFIRRDM